MLTGRTVTKYCFINSRTGTLVPFTARRFSYWLSAYWGEKSSVNDFERDAARIRRKIAGRISNPWLCNIVEDLIKGKNPYVQVK